MNCRLLKDSIKNASPTSRVVTFTLLSVPFPLFSLSLSLFIDFHPRVGCNQQDVAHFSIHRHLKDNKLCWRARCTDQHPMSPDYFLEDSLVTFLRSQRWQEFSFSNHFHEIEKSLVMQLSVDESPSVVRPVTVSHPNCVSSG